MKLSKRQVLTMLAKAKKAGACYEALTEIRRLLAEGGIEAVMASKECPGWAYWYADKVLKTRWPEAEDLIRTDAQVACEYAHFVIKARWPEAEDVIRKNSWAACWYAYYVIDARWPEAEDVIRTNARVAYWYTKHFKFEWPKEEETK